MDTQTTEERPTQASADLHASIDLVQGQLVEFDKISAGLAAIEQAHPKDVACNVSTVAGMKQAIAGRAAWREPRIALEKARKAAKAPVLALGRDIDTFARSLETKLLEGEAHYDDQIKAEEARREAERQEKVRKEAERIAGIRDAINENFTFAPSMMDGGTAAELEAEIKRMVAMEIGASYQELAGEAALAKDAALGALRRMQEKAAAREAEDARLKAEREELERQRAEQARIQAEAKKEREAEAARLRQEREALAAERAAQQRQEAEARADREKADREDRARRDEEDRQARQARAAEDKRIADERAEMEEKRHKNEMALSEIQGIEQQVIIAQLGRAGVRKGGTMECLRDTLAETEAWPITEENFGIFTGSAQAAKNKAVVEIRRLLTAAEAEAERRRAEEEEIVERRRAEEAQHQATMRVREAAPQMLALLARWQTADKSPRDKVEQQAVRVARDELLAGLQ